MTYVIIILVLITLPDTRDYVLVLTALYDMRDCSGVDSVMWLTSSCSGHGFTWHTWSCSGVAGITWHTWLCSGHSITWHTLLFWCWQRYVTYVIMFWSQYYLTRVVMFRCTLRASLSGTFLQTLPDLVTSLKRHSLFPRSCPPTRSEPSERFGY